MSMLPDGPDSLEPVTNDTVEVRKSVAEAKAAAKEGPIPNPVPQEMTEQREQRARWIRESIAISKGYIKRYEDEEPDATKLERAYLAQLEAELQKLESQ